MLRLHSIELQHTLLSNTASCLAVMQPAELPSFTLLSYAAPHWSVPAFYGAITHPTELHCILFISLLSYPLSPYWAMLYLSELRCTFWAMMHFTEPPRGTLLSSTAPYWAMLYPLSCAVPYWAKVHPADLHSTPLWASSPQQLRWTLLSYAEPYWATQHHVSYTTA